MHLIDGLLQHVNKFPSSQVPKSLITLEQDTSGLIWKKKSLT